MSDDEQVLVTINDLCKAFHRTDKAIRNLIRDGIIPDYVQKKGRKPFYDYWPCHHAFFYYIDAKGTMSKIAQKQEEHLNQKIKRLEREEAEATGELVNAKDLKRELMSFFTTIRSRIRAVAPKCAQQIAHMKTAKMKQRELLSKVQKLLSREHDEALKELSEWRK